jgi:hypothetical protein
MGKSIRKFGFLFNLLFVLAVGFFVYQWFLRYLHENEVLKQVIHRLEADTRVAEVLVTGVNYDEATQKTLTTIKFLEYSIDGNPGEPKYFTFSGNIIQFQSLVIRFEDYYIRSGDSLKGKSAFIFWKVFMLDGANTQEFEITPMLSIPTGYKLKDGNDPFETWLWKKFWMYALDPLKAKETGIKNAQIEAPGTMFVPGVLYTIKIEHDGGLRIDSSPISPILRGERVP